MRVIIFGTFDLLHKGHRFLVEYAKKRGDLFIVIARDAHVASIKGSTPTQSEEERRDAIAKKFPDATVILGDTEDFLQPIRDINPDRIVLGYDQRLPPGIDESDLPCLIERAPAYKPDIYKTSLMRNIDKK